MNELIADSGAMRELVSALHDVAATKATVLIVGEHGTGKTLVARALHERSGRAAQPLHVLSALALDLATLEAALNGAGTVVLDDVGSLPFDLQGSVLRLLERGFSARLVATASPALPVQVREGRFRADLYYRLDVFPLRVPPLTERAADLPRLCAALLETAVRGLGLPPRQLTARALARLTRQTFDGNVRGLANLLERACIRSHAAQLDEGALGLGDEATPSEGSFPAHLPLDLAELERLAIAEALRRSQGNRTHAAKLLGLGLRTLRIKLNGRPTSSANPDPAQPQVEA